MQLSVVDTLVNQFSLSAKVILNKVADGIEQVNSDCGDDDQAFRLRMRQFAVRLRKVLL